jgi:hypothetical protein
MRGALAGPTMESGVADVAGTAGEESVGAAEEGAGAGGNGKQMSAVLGAVGGEAGGIAHSGGICPTLLMRPAAGAPVLPACRVEGSRV